LQHGFKKIVHSKPMDLAKVSLTNPADTLNDRVGQI